MEAGATPSIEALALDAQGGSLAAFEELVARLEAPLYRFLWMRTRDEGTAQDLTQEAFLRAWQNIARYDSRWRFSTWLYTLADRLRISERRSRGKEPATVAAEAAAGHASHEDDPHDVVARRDSGRALWDTAARILKPEERTALWLRYAEDLSMEEIGGVLGRPAVSVRVLLFRARGRLSEALEEAGLAPDPSGPHDSPAFQSGGVGGLS